MERPVLITVQPKKDKMDAVAKTWTIPLQE
jgi:hypothetical protein